MAIFLQRLEVLFEREGMHDAIVLLAESQRAVAAEVTVGLGLADLALSSKGRHEQDEVFYLIENGCTHKRRNLRANIRILFQLTFAFPVKLSKSRQEVSIFSATAATH